MLRSRSFPPSLQPRITDHYYVRRSTRALFPDKPKVLRRAGAACVHFPLASRARSKELPRRCCSNSWPLRMRQNERIYSAAAAPLGCTHTPDNHQLCGRQELLETVLKTHRLPSKQDSTDCIPPRLLSGSEDGLEVCAHVVGTFSPLSARTLSAFALLAPKSW